MSKEFKMNEDLLPDCIKIKKLKYTIGRRYKITADIFIQQGTMKIEAECNEEDVESVARTIADLFKYKQK